MSSNNDIKEIDILDHSFVMQKDKLTSIIKDKHGNEWSITANTVYESLIEKSALFSNFDSSKHPNLVGNIAGQLQLLEFTELLIENFDFEPENELELPEFAGGGTFEIHNEVEHSLYKQSIIVSASVAEALCYILVKCNAIELPERPSFKKLIELADSNCLIDSLDAELLQQLRELRNSLHLHIDSYDINTYHFELYVTAKACLYWLLLKLLGIDEKVISIQFPYLPKIDKEKLFFEV